MMVPDNSDEAIQYSQESNIQAPKWAKKDIKVKSCAISSADASLSPKFHAEGEEADEAVNAVQNLLHVVASTLSRLEYEVQYQNLLRSSSRLHYNTQATKVEHYPEHDAGDTRITDGMGKLSQEDWSPWLTSSTFVSVDRSMLEAELIVLEKKDTLLRLMVRNGGPQRSRKGLNKAKEILAQRLMQVEARAIIPIVERKLSGENS